MLGHVRALFEHTQAPDHDDRDRQQQQRRQPDHKQQILPRLTLCNGINIIFKDQEDKFEEHDKGEKTFDGQKYMSLNEEERNKLHQLEKQKMKAMQG